jgi:hypothetical protein
LPTASIDTFFACALVVSVALIATGFFAGTMQTNVDNLANANQNGYLASLAEHIVTSCGAPADWGSNSGLVPFAFGLAKNCSSTPYELDVDKISRLSSENAYALSYPDVSKAARLGGIALGVSVSPVFSVNIELNGNETVGDITEYSFEVSTSLVSGETAYLHCYALADGFVTSVSSETSSGGIGNVQVDMPNDVSGPALLVVFARAASDERMTSFGVCSFSHFSEEPMPNNTFLSLSPLNHILREEAKVENVMVENSYIFSYSYQSNPTSLSENAYSIPSILDKSPMILVVCGTDGTTRFAEWVSYPQLPSHFGANFSNSETNVFTYIVAIKGALYKLTLSFGDVPK